MLNTGCNKRGFLPVTSVCIFLSSRFAGESALHSHQGKQLLPWFHSLKSLPYHLQPWLHLLDCSLIVGPLLVIGGLRWGIVVHLVMHSLLLHADKDSETVHSKMVKQFAIRTLRVVLERHEEAPAPESERTPVKQPPEPPTEDGLSRSPRKKTLRTFSVNNASDVVLGLGSNILPPLHGTATLDKGAEKPDEAKNEPTTKSGRRKRQAIFAKILADFDTSKIKNYYSCRMCPYGTHRKRNFVVHVRTHTGEKPHRCEVCISVFAQKAQLLRHMKIHTGERPFECNVCSKTFAERLTLRCHLRTHTGERPFKCPTCSRTFTQVGTMARHRRSCKGQKVLGKPRPTKGEQCEQSPSKPTPWHIPVNAVLPPKCKSAIYSVAFTSHRLNFRRTMRVWQKIH